MANRQVMDLEAAAEAVERARVDLLRAMRQARKSGMTYRRIGEVVGLSHETVRRLLVDK